MIEIPQGSIRLSTDAIELLIIMVAVAFFGFVLWITEGEEKDDEE